MNKPRLWQTEDLPLFSGTAPKVEVKPFDPQPEVKQLSLLEEPCTKMKRKDGIVTTAKNSMIDGQPPMSH